MRNNLEKFFDFKNNHTSWRQETIAGITTFLTMAYIVFVNPSILHLAGMDHGAVFVATCLIAAVGSFLMGSFSRYPMAVAPAMALNVYFTYVVVQGMGLQWQDALGAVFISGVIFFIIAVTRAREWIVAAIPQSLNIAISVGLGLFIGLIALKSSGIIIPNEKTLMSMGHLDLGALFFACGFIVIAVLDYYKIPGAILIGVLLTTILALIFGLAQFHGVLSLPPSLSPTLAKMRFSELLNLKGAAIIFALLFVSLFDSTGTLVGLVHHAKLDQQQHTLRRISRGLLATSTASVIGGVLGTSSPSPYLESAAGIRAGGRTGFTAWVVALLFLMALFISPLAATIPSFATAPALLFVACLMIRNVTEIPWADMSESIPAVLTVMMIPYTLSIANGVGIGIISYVILKILCRKISELNVALIILALLFVFYFIMQGVAVSL